MPRHLRVILFDRHGNVIDSGTSSAVFPLTFVVKRVRARELTSSTNGVRQMAAAALVASRKCFGAALVVCPSSTAKKSRHTTPTTSYLVSFAAKIGKHVVVGSVSCRSLGAANAAAETRVREIVSCPTNSAPSKLGR